MRRAVPAIAALAAVALLASYALYTRQVVREMRMESERGSVLYAIVVRALSDSNGTDPLGALFEIAEDIRDLGVPVILTDQSGMPVSCQNLPFCAPLDVAAATQYLPRLDAMHDPVEVGNGTVHYGERPLLRLIRLAPFAQAGLLLLLIGTGIIYVRERGRAQRDRLWAGMARETAHQLGTPLSSLNGWLELLGDREQDDLSRRALSQMSADLVRLERVSHRFERIGHPPRKEAVDVSQLATGVAEYFRSRVPTLAHPITITCNVQDAEEHSLKVSGDPVLLEWAVEVIVKNAVDAMAGRGGVIALTVLAVPEGGARIRVADDGPGISAQNRSRIFEPGFSTKSKGWGIGLALARRIVESNHGGELTLLPSEKGAVFDILLP